MPSFSTTSKERLKTCHVDLQRVFNKIIQHFDCTILEGHRTAARQEQLYLEGKSQIRVGGTHCESPSRAVDAVPYPINWLDRERMTYFAGQVVATARAMGIKLRWGGDWDKDTELRDNNFDDLCHFELA